MNAHDAATQPVTDPLLCIGRTRAERPSFAIGVAVSAAVHLLLLLIASAWRFDVPSVEPRTPRAQHAVVREAMRVYAIVLVPTATAIAEKHGITHLAAEP